ncbi:MAG: aminopeptidase [Bacteroidales bacterium]|jgi:bleomycin hydrolase|nr:aminopeptidase [Bacteroidales bacterium]
MKKFLLSISCAILLLNFSFAQEPEKQQEEAYIFEMIKEVPVTSVKDQHRSSTCWSYSALGFLEAELLRTTGKEYDLSEGFIVYKTYQGKADKYVRYHGTCNYSPGGLFHDISWTWEKYGLMPESAYTGLVNPDTLFIHGELMSITKGLLDGVIKNSNRKLSDNWRNAYDGVLNAYFAAPPQEFIYEGIKYTPESFAKSLKINLEDYVNITSWTHHPFYTQFVFELPDNWLNGSIYNVQLDEMVRMIDNALENGYTVAWAADVSDKGFSWKNGVAIMPDRVIESTSGSDAEHWTGSTKTPDLYAFDGKVIEKDVDQETRQQGFDDWTTTDDHGMVLCGIYKDQRGNKFYKVKNSWGTKSGKYDGYFYVSVPYVKMNTISIMVNKNSVPKDIRKKLDI